MVASEKPGCARDRERHTREIALARHVRDWARKWRRRDDELSGRFPMHVDFIALEGGVSNDADDVGKTARQPRHVVCFPGRYDDCPSCLRVADGRSEAIG